MVQELRHIYEIFWDAIQLGDQAARETFLARARGDDKHFCQMLLRLLKVQPRTGKFLEEPFLLGTAASSSPDTHGGPTALAAPVTLGRGF